MVIGLLQVAFPGAPAAAENDAPAEPTPWLIAAAAWRDVSSIWQQWLCIVALATVSLLLQSYLPVPGCPTGYIGAGGLANGGAFPQCTGGAHRYIDQLVLGEAHMYHGSVNGIRTSAATCADIYLCAVYDPEGILGSLNAAVIAFLGVHAGRVLLSGRELTGWSYAKSVSARWLGAGAVCLLAAGALSGWSLGDGGLLPINKNMWSLSFILLLGGVGFLLLTLFTCLVDVAGLWSGAPFTAVGQNGLAIYLGSEVLGTLPPWSMSWRGAFVSHAEELASNLCGVLCWVGVARIMQLKGIRINV